MTKSDNPNGTGGNYGQPPRQPNYGQPAAPTQPGVGGYPQDPQQMAQNPEVPVGQAYQPGVEAPYQAGQVPGQQQMAGQLPPQVPAEPYGDYVSPQVPPAPQMPVFGEEPQMDAGYAPQAPLDDYQYPQGQPILPEVPSVAVPPAMAPVAGQPMQASHQGAEPGYNDPAAAVGGAGEQISQRLAQLQNQYDEEMAGENWNAEQNAQQIPAQNMAQGNEAYTGYQAPVGEMPGFQAPHPEDQQQQLYQQVPPEQNYQQAPEAYQQGQQQQAQYTQPSMTAPQAPYGEYGQTDPNHAGSSSITEEPAGGGGMGKLMLGGAFVVALAVGGGGAYIYQYTDLLVDHQGGASAPTIKAAGSPVKILKKKISGAKESINKAMHSRLSGGSGKASMLSGGSSSEKLVQKTLNGAKEAGNKVAAASSGMLPELDRMNSVTSTRVNAPRRVRTLIVRPDGTILRPAGTDSATNMAVAPGINAADIPKAEDVARTSGNKIRRIKTIGEANIARRLGGSAGSSVKKAGVKSQTREVVRKVVPVKPVAAPNVRTAAVSVPVRGNIGTPFVVQVTSRSSQTSALAAFADMQQKYPSLIGSYTPDIQRADLGSKGIWYRLRVGPVGSKTAATDLCSSLKQAGHPGCFVRRK